MQVWVHLLQSLLMLGQTNLVLMSFWVTLMPGCDIEWSESNVSLLMTAGTKGRRGPVELSQTMVCLYLPVALAEVGVM